MSNHEKLLIALGVVGVVVLFVFMSKSSQSTAASEASGSASSMLGTAGTVYVPTTSTTYNFAPGSFAQNSGNTTNNSTTTNTSTYKQVAAASSSVPATPVPSSGSTFQTAGTTPVTSVPTPSPTPHAPSSGQPPYHIASVLPTGTKTQQLNSNGVGTHTVKATSPIHNVITTGTGGNASTVTGTTGSNPHNAFVNDGGGHVTMYDQYGIPTILSTSQAKSLGYTG